LLLFFSDKENQILPPRSAAALLGTIQYASLASHNFQEQCRRDDLESWLYMCVELCSGEYF
jgi:tau tubulin kinase